MARQICLQYADQERTLHVLTVAPELEQRLVAARVEAAGGPTVALEPQAQRRWLSALRESVRSVQDKGHAPIVLVSEAARAPLKNSTIREIPHLVVLSVPEIVPDIRVESLGEIRTEA
jgi:flagellar biosynthesis protein FlhA